MEIKLDDLSGEDITKLIKEHRQSMFEHSPAESVHALDIEELRKENITFWSVWEGGELVGCGALKELTAKHGEIKCMRTSPLHLRKGVGGKMLAYIEEEGKRRGYEKLSLETGSAAAFEPAVRLYCKFGFCFCPPFADYLADPHSLFLSKPLL